PLVEEGYGHRQLRDPQAGRVAGGEEALPRLIGQEAAPPRGPCPVGGVGGLQERVAFPHLVPQGPVETGGFGRLLLSPSVGAHALEGPGFRVEDDGPEALVGLVSLPSPRPPGLPETPERVGAGCRL